ncbi:hypothetical protein AJ78_00474 [Emergomyces pasteurianus Ep9510]|uniref:Uncharacterized protein n=1 Tax=Emergomyces pasteurianus Ep9510 TaxID=1447872 RepID=A0A1J9PT78_9EURO|nr:hypothetical protein AJ78_00474 [Emergomyces pasteurianus Ep9510]
MSATLIGNPHFPQRREQLSPNYGGLVRRSKKPIPEIISLCTQPTGSLKSHPPKGEPISTLHSPPMRAE